MYIYGDSMSTLAKEWITSVQDQATNFQKPEYFHIDIVCDAFDTGQAVAIETLKRERNEKVEKEVSHIVQYLIKYTKFLIGKKIKIKDLYFNYTNELSRLIFIIDPKSYNDKGLNRLIYTTSGDYSLKAFEGGVRISFEFIEDSKTIKRTLIESEGFVNLPL